jgi:large subunit ribosomal protein L4
MAVAVLGTDGAAAAEAPLFDALAAQAIKPHLIHETVVAELAARRAGTHSTKNRGEVRGGGKKPWRQKGTGRARHGSIRSPIWTGGGVTFGPRPRKHGGKVNRKVRVQAFRSALRAHAERGSMAIMDPTGWDAPSTRRAAAYLANAPAGLAARPLLVIVEDVQGFDALSFRNLADVYVLAASEVQTVDVMAGRSLLVARAVWERYAGGAVAAEPSAAPAAAPAAAGAAPAEAEPADEPSAAEAEPVEEPPAAEAEADPVDAVPDETAPEAAAPADDPDSTETEEGA